MERMCNKWWKSTKTLLNQRPTYALQSSYNNILKKLKWSWFKHHKKLTQLAINNTITKHLVRYFKNKQDIDTNKRKD
jgi:hypothetical protein